MGHKVIAGDTDSIFIQMPKKVAKEFEIQLNNMLLEYSKSEGLVTPLKIKLDKYAKRVIFVKARTKEEAAKKRYGLYIIEQKNKACDYVKIVGFDAIKRNCPKIGRESFKKAIELVLREKEDELGKHLRDVVNRIKSGKVPIGELALPMTLHKRFNEYKTKNPWLRGVFWSNQYLNADIVSGDYVFLIYGYLRGYPMTDVISFIYPDQVPMDKLEINYNEMIEKGIRKKIEPILEIIGKSWEACMNSQDMSKW
jgi:DNA polymerase elongation subunit (family B)